VATLLNGLETPELGLFPQDPAVDSVFELARKVRDNTLVLDPIVGEVDSLTSNVQSLEDKGLVVGFVYGGSF
jgi:hypothetical protein